MANKKRTQLKKRPSVKTNRRARVLRIVTAVFFLLVVVAVVFQTLTF